MDSTSPRRGEKASYYSAVSLETGEVEWMELEGNSNSETSVVFLRQLRERHPGHLNVIWGNAPAHRGEAVREYLRTPGLGLRLVNPHFHGGGHRKPVPGKQGPGAGEGQQLPQRAGRPERRSETALPDHPAVKDQGAPAELQPRFPTLNKCTSHLGFSLVVHQH